jgi:uncharacterized membrane protein YjjB (DUF3815 family)
MDWLTPLHNGFWAALFAAALALSFTAPARVLPVVLIAGFAGRFSRDALMQLDLLLPMATVLGALAATALALIAAREPASVPVAAVTAVLPLGPTTLVFNALRAVFEVFAADPAVATAAAADFTTNTLRAFVVVAAMAIGTALPLLVSRDRY